jgi:hypothetical protein
MSGHMSKENKRGKGKIVAIVVAAIFVIGVVWMLSISDKSKLGTDAVTTQAATTSATTRSATTKSADDMALEYVASMPYSKTELIKQLEEADGFSAEEAEAAASQSSIDYESCALLAAQNLRKNYGSDSTHIESDLTDLGYQSGEIEYALAHVND